MKKSARIWETEGRLCEGAELCDVNEQEERKAGDGMEPSDALAERLQSGQGTQKSGAEAREGFGGFAAACAALSLACLVCAVGIMLYFV